MKSGKKPIEPKETALKATDWARVKREATLDAPVPHDPDSEPYNPQQCQCSGRLLGWCHGQTRPWQTRRRRETPHPEHARRR